MSQTGNTGLMVAANGVGAISSIGGAIAGSNAQRVQGQVQQMTYDANAAFADVAGSSAIQVGNTKARMLALQTRGAIGSQRASAAAGGVDVNSGSAAKVQESTAGMSAIDQLMIKNNAALTAFGYKASALNLQGRGKMAAMAGNAASGSTLLTGGLSALNYGIKAGYYGSLNKGGGSDSVSDDNSDNFNAFSGVPS